MPPNETPHRSVAFFVPVRHDPSGSRSIRILRTAVGERTAVCFTTSERLIAVLGTEQRWVRLALPALRALVEPLGVTTVTVDPQLSAPQPQPEERSSPSGARTPVRW